MAKFHEIPTLTEEGLKTCRELREKTITLKKEAYGEQNPNTSESLVQFNPVYMNKRELDNRLYDIFSGEDVKKLSEEHRELRSRIDYELVRTVVEKIFPFYLSLDTPLSYYLQVAARDMNKIDSKTDPHRGRDDKHTYMGTFTAKEWIDAWKEYVLLDKRACNIQEIRKYMPERTDCPLSTVHKFFTVEKSKRKNGKNNNGFPLDYEINMPKFEFDCRTKSGQQFAYKLVRYLTGEKEGILDLAAGRLLFDEMYENKSISLFRHFMDNEKGECKDLLILQSLHRDMLKQREDFLKNLSKYRNFCEKFLSVEDRSKIFTHEELKYIGKKHYLEMLLFFSTTSSDSDLHFGRNVIAIQSYERGTFKKILQKRDHFLYEGRADDEREGWTYLNWKLLEIVNNLFLVDFSNQYIKQVVAPRLRSSIG